MPVDIGAPGVVIMHSGGLDSLAALYLTLRDTGIPVHAHHIRMKFEFRVSQELAAVQRQWTWLATNMRPFTTTISLDPNEARLGLRDEHVVLPAAATALTTLAGFGRVMTGRCHEESQGEEGGAFDPEAHAKFEVIAGIPYIDARLFDPSRDWTKRQKFDALPASLRETAWGCRGSFRADFKACGHCHTCTRYEAAGIFEATHL
jgi:7-cyano-7-deazaguanine synthase in queuosine biosynthesis